MNILIVEDDINLANSIVSSFKKHNFSNRADIISSYNEFLLLAGLSFYDIVLLDINLDSCNKNTGIDILEHIRKNNKEIPIIMISSHHEYHYLEKAFKKGAHDYIIKPFRNRELQIRIQRWFVNYILIENFFEKKFLSYYALTYDFTSNMFLYHNNYVSLTKSNKYILLLFFINKEKVLTREFLVGKIWGSSEDDSKKNLRLKILRLKNELELIGIGSWIQTIRGEGFMFKK